MFEERTLRLIEKSSVMSTIRIKYSFSTFVCKVTPITLLNDVLIDSLEYFKLGTNIESWSLFYDDKQLPLTVSWRLLNLPSRSEIILKNISNKSLIKEKTVNIEISSVEYGSISKCVHVSSNIFNMIEDICDDHDWNLNLKYLKFEICNKVLNYEEIQCLNFNNFGIDDNIIIKLISYEKNKNNTEDFTDKQMYDINQKKEVKNNLENIKVFIPPIESKVMEIEDYEEEMYELTLNDVVKYQEMLSKRSFPKEILTRRLREYNQTKSQILIQKCEIKIKFPDRSYIQSTFDAEAKIYDIYEFVSQSLINRSMEFKLVLPYPRKPLINHSLALVSDLNFGSKTSIVVETLSKGPFIKPSIVNMQNGNKVMNIITQPRDNNSPMLSSNQETKEYLKANKTINSKFKEQKLFKFLKLSKK